ncbi:MAG: T9SS type A sorting domain-containing protein [Saprospiraceae bacterium]|nr:T9SS type A sorting domain-containing protein [Saprospiraceae bacterium]
MPDWPDHLKNADLDGDGLTDLLPVYRDGGLTPGQSWLKNLGNGQFADPQALDPVVDLSNYVKEIAAGDIDLDGDADVIAFMSSDLLVLYENAGSSQFSAKILAVWPEVQSLSRLTLGNFDGDGLPDLVANYYIIGPVLIKNLGSGQFAPRQTILPKLLSLAVAEATDFNQDGLKDILVISGNDGKLAWYPNLGGAQFGPNQIITHTNYNGAFAHGADLDGDGDQDILSGIPKEWDVNLPVDELVWYPNNGDGTFGERIRVTPDSFYLPVHIAEIADIDGDGHPDIVCLVVTATQSLAWLRNDGAGNFEFPIFITPGELSGSFSLTDLDGDSDKDILVNFISGVHWLANDGTGHFEAPAFVGGPVYNNLIPPFAEDLDADGDMDVFSDFEWWYPNQGEQSFGSANHTPLDLIPTHFTDLNHDAKPDLIGNYGDLIGWKPNLGNGVFGDRIIIHFKYNQQNRNAWGVDVDGNGDLEILYSWESEIGYFDDFGGLPYISGHCFLDENENGLRDSTEVGLPDIQTELVGASRLGYSDAEGQFRFYVTPGAYTLSFLPSDCWALTSDSSSWHISVSDTAILDKYFGFKPTLGVRKLTTMLASGPTICAQDVAFWLQTRNDGCLPASGKIALLNEENLAINWSEPPPDAVVGDTLFWLVDSLYPGEIQKINLLFQLGVLPAGDTLRMAALSETYGADGVTPVYRDTFSFQSAILCSYDPNDKLVDRPELPPNYQPEDGELIYTVRFQNTGNYLAFNIRIRDTLDAGLDWATLRPLFASHDFFTGLDIENGIVEFNFPDILLADSTSNEPLSHGFVSFAIRPKAGLAEGTLIPNRAGIYFDYNPPVITNYAETRVGVTVSVRPEKSADNWVSFFPNPASTAIALQFSQSPGLTRVRIFDMQGRNCLDRPLETAGLTASLDLPSLPAAAYILEITGENGELRRAILVIHQ